MLLYPYREGQPVTYHGSQAKLHERPLTAWQCACRSAHPVERPRFMLADEAGQVIAWHVRPTSLNPA